MTPPLDSNEIFDIFAYQGLTAGVPQGNEVVLKKDGCANMLEDGQMSSGVDVPLAREQGIRVMERAFGFDTMEVGHPDYSFKPAKALVALEQVCIEQALIDCVVPLFYGAMPNMGLCFRPDAPFADPADPLPRGQIEEAREAQLQSKT